MGFLGRSSLCANLGLKVELSAWLTERKTRAVSYAEYILFLSLVSKAESSDKNLTGIFMNKLGLKEPGFENRRTFSKKAREPQKLSRFQKFALVSQRSQSRTDKQAFKRAWNSRTSVTKAMPINREQNFPNNELERIIYQQTHCKKDNAFEIFPFLFWTRKRFLMSQSRLTISGQAQATLLFSLY